jgi:hypothetical protein
MGKGDKGHGHGGHGRSHGGHKHGGHHGHSFGHHHHHIGSSSFGSHHIGTRSRRHYGGGRGADVPKYITDPNWENQPNIGQWKGGLCDCCSSPGDFACACYCPCLYSAMLANDIGKNFIP